MGKKSSRAVTRAGRRRERAADSLAPSPWDEGPDTPAARFNTVLTDGGDIDPETGERRNPNGVKTRVRHDQIKKLHSTGVLSDRQYSAAKELKEAHELRLLSSPAIKEINVDSQPDPQRTIAMMIDSQARVDALTAHIPSECHGVVCDVVMHEVAISKSGNGWGNARTTEARRSFLRLGLDALADGLRM